MRKKKASLSALLTPEYMFDSYRDVTPEFLTSLVLKAVQDALEGARQMADAEMRKVTGGLGFPM